MAAPVRKYEEYESDDEVSRTGWGFNRKDKSYDIIARNCGGSASDLQKWAKIRRLKPSCRIYKDIVTYAEKSQGTTKVTIQRVYKIDRLNERQPFNEKFRMLLWHGTSPQAVSGIIQSGFRPGASGLYGGGIYFADRLAKSIGYTRKANNIGYLFIAEVCLGKNMNPLFTYDKLISTKNYFSIEVYKAHHTHATYTSAPSGFDSVKGNGSSIPTWRQNRHYHGAILPCGETKQNSRFSQYDLSYNEYILYDHQRVIIRFLVECTW